MGKLSFRLAGALALALSLVPAADANASVGIGGTAGTGMPPSLVGCGVDRLYTQKDVGNPSYEVPSAGVITSWSTMGPSSSGGSLALKVVREGPVGTHRVMGTSELQAIALQTLNQFRTRIEVVGGDRLALWATSGAACAFSTSNAGDVISYGGSASANPGVGQDYVTSLSLPNYRINVSAQLEPDADGDGYGDESQDACPAEPLAHDLPCDRTPPETTITEVPERVKAKGRNVKVKISFISSEPGASFRCKLDAKSSACASPFIAKVKRGAHQFSVVATDLTGNADPTPAKADFTVIRKKPKRAG